MSTEQKLDRIADLMEHMAILLNVTITKTSTAISNTGIVGPDEAARILNLPVTKGKTHTRRLKYFREHGFLTKFTGTSPYYYNVQELQSLAQRIADGQVMIPPV